jgi:hypothetical protein
MTQADGVDYKTTLIPRARKPKRIDYVVVGDKNSVTATVAISDGRRGHRGIFTSKES